MPLNEHLFDGHGNVTLIGGLGDDTYFVAPGTRVVEAALSGVSTADTWTWSYTLTAHVENLRLYADMRRVPATRSPTASSAMTGTKRSMVGAATIG